MQELRDLDARLQEHARWYHPEETSSALVDHTAKQACEPFYKSRNVGTLGQMLNKKTECSDLQMSLTQIFPN